MDSFFDNLSNYLKNVCIEQAIDDLTPSLYVDNDIRPAIKQVEAIKVEGWGETPSLDYKEIVSSVRAKLLDDVEYKSNDILCDIENTTNTIEGQISNVSFHEEELIKRCIPNKDIVIISCNYGKVMFDGYHPPVKVNKTKRGRKKKQKPPVHRKKQGDGTEFNSQITFSVMPSGGDKPYKFKIFRTGKLQLPGAHTDLIDDIIDKVEMIICYLRDVLNKPSINLISLSAVMKNYKLGCKMPMHHIVKLTAFAKILQEYRTKNKYDIFMIKYSRQDSKMAVRILTPCITQQDHSTQHDKDKKPSVPVINKTKTARINIFMKGKINILGASGSQQTEKLCNIMYEIIKINFDTIIVPEGDKWQWWRYNIDPLSIDEIARIESQQSNMALSYADNQETTACQLNMVPHDIDQDESFDGYPSNGYPSNEDPSNEDPSDDSFDIGF